MGGGLMLPLAELDQVEIFLVSMVVGAICAALGIAVARGGR